MATTTQIPGMRNFLGLKNVSAIREVGFLQFLMDGWREYGDFYFIELGSSGMHVVINPDDVQKILLKNAANYTKLSSYNNTRQYLMGNGLVTSIGDEWLWQRRLLAPFFTPRGVAHYTTLFIQETQAMLARWQQHDTLQPLNISDEMVSLTLSIILKVIFNVESDDRLTLIQEDVETLFKFAGQRRRSVIKTPLWLPTENNQQYQAARQRLNSYIEELVAKRHATPKAQWSNDILSKILSAEDDASGRSFSQQDIIDQCITFFVAGHETTARMMTFALYALSQNPDVQTQLIAEIDAKVAGDVPTVDELKQMPYTLRTLKETLRLYPSAAFYPRDVIDDDTLSGYAVGAGTALMLFPYGTHRHPDYWQDPLTFDPDRFSPEREATRHPFAYAPFSGGKRICIGNNFSLLEGQIILATLYKHVIPQLVTGHDPQIMATATLAPSAGMPMHINWR